MSQHHNERDAGGAALRPDEIAAEGAAELPDREAMSLISGPGGAGPLPMLTQPVGPMTPDTYPHIVQPQEDPMPVAQDLGPTS